MYPTIISIRKWVTSTQITSLSFLVWLGIWYIFPTHFSPTLASSLSRLSQTWRGVRLLSFHHLFWPAECSLMLFLARFGSYFHFRYGHSHAVAPTGNSFFPDIPLGSVHFHNAIGFHHCSLWFFFLSLLLPSCSVTSRR